MISKPLRDRPIYDSNDDQFDFEANIVSKIKTFLEDQYVSLNAVAIAGEWGIGKTSVINLLCKQIESNEKNM